MKNLFDTQLPEVVSKSLWRLRALYDLMGGNSSRVKAYPLDRLEFNVEFMKESNRVPVSVNTDKVIFELNPTTTEYFLTRTRLHKYLDNSIIVNFFSKFFYI